MKPRVAPFTSGAAALPPLGLALVVEPPSRLPPQAASSTAPAVEPAAVIRKRRRETEDMETREMEQALERERPAARGA